MCPIDAVFTRLEPHFSYDAADGPRFFSFAFLRHRSFVLKCPFHCIAVLLEFHQWRKPCWLLVLAPTIVATNSRRTSLLTENLAKSHQVLEALNCHSQPFAAECSNGELCSACAKKTALALLERQTVTSKMR
jgi:hypothetical protein